MCDGYGGYNCVKKDTQTACFAYIRRYLIEAIPKGKELEYAQPAVQGVMYIDHLFRLEEKSRKPAKSFDEIKKARLEKEKPVLEAFLVWLDIQTPKRGPAWSEP